MARVSLARNRIRAAAAGTEWWALVKPADSPSVDRYRHRRGWVLAVEFTVHDEIESVTMGRWEPAGAPSEKLAAVIKVLASVK